MGVLRAFSNKSESFLPGAFGGFCDPLGSCIVANKPFFLLIWGFWAPLGLAELKGVLIGLAGAS